MPVISDSKIHVGDIGTLFQLFCVDTEGEAVDISSASEKKFFFEDPNGTKTEKTGSFITAGNTGNTGLLEYASILGDINLAGDWKYQGWVKISTKEFHTEIVEFTVYESLKP